MTTTTLIAPHNARPPGSRHPEAVRGAALRSLIDELTVHAWLDAGLRQGMRVLTAGHGIGEFSLLAAAMVGAKGSVIGIDPSTEAIRSAMLRAAEAGSNNLRFTRQELHLVKLGAPVDAVLVRSGLLHLDDPWSALRGLVHSVKPGGLIVVQHVGDDDESMSAIVETTFDRLGLASGNDSAAERRMALRLHRIFRAAGLPSPQLTLSADVRSRHLREAALARPAFVSASTRA